MDFQSSLDFETYCQIKDQLPEPIPCCGLSRSLLRRLYRSKLFYLEALRKHCFFEINGHTSTRYSQEDYSFILEALRQTKSHIQDLVALSLS